MCLGQAGKTMFITGQFAQCPALIETPDMCHSFQVLTWSTYIYMPG